MMRPPTIPYDPDRVTRGAIVQFVALCAVAFVIVGLATFAVASKLASHEALHDAEVRGELFTMGVAAPLVNRPLREGRPWAVHRFDTVMRNRLALGSIAHIKVWDPDGTIIWADEKGLTGRTLPIPEQVAQQQNDRFTLSWQSSATTSGDGNTQGEEGRLEVYVGTLDADGNPIIMESYWSASAIESQYDLVLRQVAPLSLGALVLLTVAIVPLGISLARRLARSNRERDRMLQHALRASDLERRRMTQILHDGVIQDLAGLVYLLPSVTPRDPHSAEESELRSTLVDATALLKTDVGRLREILADLYPPSLEREGLEPALRELAEWAGRSGIEVTVSARGTEDLEPAYARLAYRVVREGLLNVINHSGAQHAQVRVSVTSRSGVDISVRDDGLRRRPAVAEAPKNGHFGLRLLEDVLADLGGDLVVVLPPTGGTELRASLPGAVPADGQHEIDEELLPL